MINWPSPREGIGKQTETNSTNSPHHLEIDNKNDPSKGESFSKLEKNDLGDFDKNDNSFQVGKLDKVIRKVKDKSDSDGNRENVGENILQLESSSQSNNENNDVRDLDKYDANFEVRKVEEFIKKVIDKSDLQGNRANEIKSKIPSKTFKKIAEDKYLHTIFRNDDFTKTKSKSKSKLVKLRPKKKVLYLNENPERIIEKINKLNENDFNKKNESKKVFDLTKPSKPKSLVKWKESSYEISKLNVGTEPRETTTKKIKLRRRKKKKVNRNENTTEPLSVLRESDFQEKVRKPLKKEWNTIFQGTNFQRKDYQKSTTTASTARPTKFYNKSLKKKKSQNRDLSVLRGLVEKYCRFEDSIGIIRLCESQKLSNKRKFLAGDVGFVPLAKVEEMKTETFQKTKLKKENSFMENVKSAFSNILSYF